MKLKRLITAAALVLAAAAVLAGCASGKTDSDRIAVKVLILPKFEVSEITGDFPGEAQYYYDEYLAGGEEYTVRGSGGDTKLYYRDGVALCILGQGKISAALGTDAVLSDPRFDFSDTCFISTGCGGAAAGYGILGDVFVVSASADYDLGHHADPREMNGEMETTWFRDETLDGIAVIRTDQGLTDAVYGLVKDVRLETTDRTEKYMKASFPGEEWADRRPCVLKGTSVTGDNFWKGGYDHQNALLITETYGCADPYAVTEMEDIAVGRVLDSFGMLDRLVILRAAVNMDVFTPGVTPETLWGDQSDDSIASDDSEESADIFATAMDNNFKVGKIIIDEILSGGLDSLLSDGWQTDAA